MAACHYSAGAADYKPAETAEGRAKQWISILEGLTIPQDKNEELQTLIEIKKAIIDLVVELKSLEAKERANYREIIKRLRKIQEVEEIKSIDYLETNPYAPDVDRVRVVLKNIIKVGKELALKVQEHHQRPQDEILIEEFTELENARTVIEKLEEYFADVKNPPRVLKLAWWLSDYWPDAKKYFIKLTENGLENLFVLQQNNPQFISDLNVYEIAIARVEFLFVKSFYLTFDRLSEVAHRMDFRHFAEYLQLILRGALATHNDSIVLLVQKFKGTDDYQEIKNRVAYPCGNHDNWDRYSTNEFRPAFKSAKWSVEFFANDLKGRIEKTADLSLDMKYAFHILSSSEKQNYDRLKAQERAKGLNGAPQETPGMSSEISCTPKIELPSTQDNLLFPNFLPAAGHYDVAPPHPGATIYPAPMPTPVSPVMNPGFAQVTLPQHHVISDQPWFPVSQTVTATAATVEDLKKAFDAFGYYEPYKSEPVSGHRVFQHELILTKLKELVPGYESKAEGNPASVPARKVRRIKDIDTEFTNIVMVDILAAVQDVDQQKVIKDQLDWLFSKSNPDNDILLDGGLTGGIFRYFGTAESARWLLDR